MQALPDLSQLSHNQKDELIRQLWAIVQAQSLQIATLQAQVAELQAKLNKNSRNSSKPPSSDGLRKPAPKSLRVAGQNPNGGQKGHIGKTLNKVEQPNHVVIHDAPANCTACQKSLTSAHLHESRQVFDLPVTRFEVTEHQVMQAICTCGQAHTGEFPAGVTASVQYGPRVLATMVHLNQNHAVSVKRTADVVDDLFGLPVSEATVLEATRDSARILQPAVARIAQAVIESKVAHADESGLRVAGKLNWLHVLVTESLTWMGIHAKRGTEAFEGLGLLPQFKGVLVHDGLAAYKKLDCEHALCNAHHLRELTYLLEEEGQAWAGDVMEVLKHANHLDNLNCADGEIPDYDSLRYQETVQELQETYEALLTYAQDAHPVVEGRNNKRGRTKQSKSTNLIRRLLEYKEDVWRFMTQLEVPFTNNTAEQAVRMPKVKQKVSGCFRTPDGAMHYCTIRSYCATLQKQGIHVFDALVAAFNGSPTEPAFA
jgi:transposase